MPTRKELDFGGIFKIIQIYERYDGASKMQIDNADLFLKLFYIQCKEIRNKKYYEKTRELEKRQIEISPKYWR